MRGRKGIKLSPMQRAILSFPGSDGRASVRLLLDHLWHLFPRTSREAFIDEVGKNLIKLHRLGDFYLARQYGVDRLTVTVNEWDDFSLRNFVGWDRASQQWAVSKRQEEVDDILIQLLQGGINDLKLYGIQNKKAGVESQ